MFWNKIERERIAYRSVPWLHDIRPQMESVVFVNPEATGTFLAAVAGSLMTVTSILPSLMLVKAESVGCVDRIDLAPLEAALDVV